MSETKEGSGMNELIIKGGAAALEFIPILLKLFRGKDAPPFSVALATGYYCNFLYQLYDKMKVGELEFSQKGASQKMRSFREENIQIKILVPQALDDESRDQCDKTQKLEGPNEGYFRWEENNRDYAFRYDVKRGANNQNNLIIVDVARPLFAVETFHRHAKFFDSGKEKTLSAEKWDKIQRREIEAYPKTILYLHNNLKFKHMKRPGFYAP